MDYHDMVSHMEVALFDMDGTLLDSMMDWRRCNVDFLERQGVIASPAMRQKMLQCSGGMLADLAQKTFGIQIDQKALLAFQKERMRAAYERGVPVKPGVREYLAHLRSRGVTLVVATATWSTLTTLALGRCGLLSSFDAIYCTDLVGCSKREAAYFDRVAAFVGRPKEACVLFEDALYALRGGRDAGLLGEVAVADVLNVAVRDDLRALADVYVETLAELLPENAGSRSATGPRSPSGGSWR